MGLTEKWRSYVQDPFGFVDNLHLRIKGLDLNIFARSRSVASRALVFSLAMLVLWCVFGFDSSPLQFIHVLEEGLPPLLEGRPVPDLGRVYAEYYGKETHYSAFVIYGLMFWALSVHLDQGLEAWFFSTWLRRARPPGLGISRSRNLVFSCCLTFLAIGSFEWFWILSFGFWQRQPWIYTWRFPQAKILIQNTIFMVVGVLGLLYMWADSYVLQGKEVVGRRFLFRLDRWALILAGLTAGCVLLWYFYPWPVQQLTVPLADGTIWASSPRFPQTLYTIKTDPASLVNAGSWFWIQNDPVHALNTLVKVLWTLTVLYVAMIRKGGRYEAGTSS